MATYPIPGGTAEFSDAEDMTVGQQRDIARMSRKISRNAIDLAIAGDVDGQTDIETDLAGMPVDLDQADMDAMWTLADEMILFLLKSWTIERPLPETVEDITALPSKLYLALHDAVAKTQAADGGFSPAAIEDRTSPTGASGV